MSIGQALLTLLRDLIFPPRCALCRQPGPLLCPTCLATFPSFDEPRCPRCDLPALSSGRPCRACQRGALPGLAGVRVVGPHRGPLRAAILALKFDGRRALAEPLGQMLAARWQTAPAGVDALVPVPLHPARRKERGFNQSRLLAEAAGARLELPLRPALLRRTRPTPQQVGLSWEARQQNVAGAFHATPDAAGGRWLLVDDVCTTGATLVACSAALRDAGAVAVWALTLARPAGEGERGNPN